jgi:hypothetical protein
MHGCNCLFTISEIKGECNEESGAGGLEVIEALHNETLVGCRCNSGHLIKIIIK